MDERMDHAVVYSQRPLAVQSSELRVPSIDTFRFSGRVLAPLPTSIPIATSLFALRIVTRSCAEGESCGGTPCWGRCYTCPPLTAVRATQRVGDLAFDVFVDKTAK